MLNKKLAIPFLVFAILVWMLYEASSLALNLDLTLSLDPENYDVLSILDNYLIISLFLLLSIPYTFLFCIYFYLIAIEFLIFLNSYLITQNKTRSPPILYLYS